MTIQANKLLVRRFYEEVWFKGHMDVVDEVFVGEYIRHDLRPGDPLPGPAGQKMIATSFRTAFPDVHGTLDLLIAEDDLIMARVTLEGTHTGPWRDIPPTGKRARFSLVNIFRIANGKVVEIWNHRDDLGLMQQLGVPIFTASGR